MSMMQRSWRPTPILSLRSLGWVIQVRCISAPLIQVPVASASHFHTYAEAEGRDRGVLTLPGCPSSGSCPSGPTNDQTALLKAVRTAMTKPHQKLVLVLVSAGPIALTNIIDYDAVLYAGLGGQAAGYGVADVMWGGRSPSARFPVTVYEPDYLSKVGPILDYSTTSGVGRTYRCARSLSLDLAVVDTHPSTTGTASQHHSKAWIDNYWRHVLLPY